MTKTSRARYTLEFKQEAARLVEAGQSIAAAARTLGVVEQTLFNWVKAERIGKLKGAHSKVVSAEQMEISRQRWLRLSEHRTGFDKWSVTLPLESVPHSRVTNWPAWPEPQASLARTAQG